ncbi:2-keto-3-deoxygluconate permease [Erysipelothrix sp. HDW6C]|uniref:2-keto-3-deoxygluconate permease n=1 Tax=Erysipelothrix sp. HDW6C TaxID=2714930 RepID=UPI0014079206|nr:2-keto-3-deoxygluconate permease [Erysipelothrix sp. HDW6C]QIK69571.1 2-keto-3-deoxygluconate permease [Erysipelothrix sp. HDW6C]
MKTLKKIPGGCVIVPLILGMVLNTFFPQILNLGGPSTSLFKNGSAVLMGLFLIICGTQINIKQAGLPLYKGSILLILKLVLSGVVGWIAGRMFGPAGILGITPFALYCALPSNNSSLYAALCGEYGDGSDAGAVSVLSLKNGPFGTLIVMGLSGSAQIPFAEIISVLILIGIGVIWGNLDPEFKKLCKDSQDLIVMFMTFSVGATSNLSNLLVAGIPGILLGVISLLLGFIIHYIYNLTLKKKTPLGIAMGTVAANSALTPALIAATDPSLQELVPVTAAMCATASIVTMIIVPFLVDFYAKQIAKREGTTVIEECDDILPMEELA